MTPLEELEFCLEHWEKNGQCTFGGTTKCIECGSPYLLLKMITGEVLHGDMKRLTLEEWKGKVEDIKNQP
ncbi:hypothetical protein KY359_03050 [Candidatus Woesearchaeota archaeon]|nr:hypothetical protein [Candidatus Woesearchaeota archaeon]